MEDRRQSWTRGLRSTVTSRKNNTIVFGVCISIILFKFGLSETIQIFYATAILGSVGTQVYNDVKTPKAPNAE